MSPHADPAWVGIGISFYRRDRIEHVDRIVWLGVHAARLPLRPIMSAVIRAEDDVAAAGDLVHIGNISFRGAIDIRRDVAVVEDHHRPACGRFLPVGNGHQRVDFQSIGEIGNVIAIVIPARVEDLLDDDVAARIVARPHGVDLERMRI